MLFQSENFSNWVIGPELGKFIAGIRNDETSVCVHGLSKAWKYASKAAVWKDDDPTLTVKCYEPEDDQEPGVPFGSRRTTTRLPATIGLNNRVATTTEDPPVDCEWTDFSDWSPCTASCNTGTSTRSRRVARIARNGGRRCLGSAFETRVCNSQRCPVTTTTTTTTTTQTTTTTERRRPEPRRNRVNCFTCGSLFTTDAPDCGFFNSSDVSQRKTCDAGEVCLWYSYLKAANERATIRECYSPRILLGSIDNPLEAQETCSPKRVEEGDDSVLACLCTEDYCNGFGAEDEQIRRQPPRTEPPRRQPPRTEPPRRQPPRTEPPRRQTTRTEAPRRQLTTSRPSFNNFQPQRSDPNRVLCHQCGSFFSNDGGNCDVFDRVAPSQRKYCDPGEACLYYSWQKSATETAAIRECFSPTILLGSVDNPLRVKKSCDLQDISETPGASIMACLCDSDLCNANEDVNDPIAFPLIADPPA